jgi:hypothetical protein
MPCPRCNHDNFIPTAPCPACGFEGDPALLLEIAQIDYLLAEINRWAELSPAGREPVRQRYERRRREIKIELGLRPPPLSAEAARQAAWELACLEKMARMLADWGERGWLETSAAQSLVEQHRQQAALRPTPAAPGNPGERPRVAGRTARPGQPGRLGPCR